MTIEEIKKTSEYRKIKKSLLDQLKRRDCDTPYYRSLVQDYMSMYATKEMAVQDVEERGNIIHYTGTGGSELTKKNESSELIIKLNAQMLKLLDTLGIKPQSEVASIYERL